MPELLVLVVGLTLAGSLALPGYMRWERHQVALREIQHQLRVMSERIERFAVSIGEALLPSIRAFTVALNGLPPRLAAYVEAMQRPTEGDRP